VLLPRLCSFVHPSVCEDLEFRVKQVKLSGSRPVCLGGRHPSGALEQIFVFCLDNSGRLDVWHPL
jgi:hypothetical protein